MYQSIVVRAARQLIALTHLTRRAVPLSGASLFAICLGIVAPPALAHGELHDQIANMDRKIAAEPKSAALYLRRAELHRIHREWDAADLDYAKVLELEPKHAEVSWLRARAWLEADKAVMALRELDRYLARFPDHASARLTRARALAVVGRNAQSAADYAIALERLPQTEPDHYLEQHRVQQSAGLSWETQLASLEKGLRRLGSVPSLEDAALDVEVRAKQWDAALARLDRQASAAARKERWLYRRGLVLVQADRKEQASDAFHASLDAIDRLPPALRTPRATTLLAEQVHQELARLGGDVAVAREAKP
jgi:predicted Zn-dependent protease